MCVGVAEGEDNESRTNKYLRKSSQELSNFFFFEDSLKIQTQAG
jgi:hypothetical protein